MSHIAISVRSLGKMYRLAHEYKRTDSFREALTSAILSPLKRLRQLRGTDESMEEFWALKDVSFDVQPGEVVGIIGRNGAGKSTLLKILSRIVEPTEGEIVLRGRVASLLEVGTGFHPELSGRENICLNGSILGMKKREIDRKFDEIVDFAEVERFLDTPVKRYSSGMYVRLAFAVAAHLDPEILIVDEVLAVGDAEFQKKCLGKMKEVAMGTGRTVLFVSHNMAAVNALCTKACVLKSGHVDFYGNVSTAIERYSCISSRTMTPVNLQTSIVSIRDIQFHGKDRSALRTFSPCSLDVTMELKKSLASLGVHVMIQDSSGNLLCGFETRSLNANISGALGDVKVLRFEIESLPLLPGQYELFLVVRDDTTFRAEQLPDPFYIDVVESPVYGTAQLPKVHFGTVGLQIRASSENQTSMLLEAQPKH